MLRRETLRNFHAFLVKICDRRMQCQCAHLKVRHLIKLQRPFPVDHPSLQTLFTSQATSSPLTWAESPLSTDPRSLITIQPIFALFDRERGAKRGVANSCARIPFGRQVTQSLALLSTLFLFSGEVSTFLNASSQPKFTSITSTTPNPCIRIGSQFEIGCQTSESFKMVESPPQPQALGCNPNKNNTSSPYFGYSFRQTGFESSSPCMTDVSSSIRSLRINDENTPPVTGQLDGANAIDSAVGQASEQAELALVKAELEATRRKLAEYEARKADASHTSPQIVKYNPLSRNVFLGKSSSALHSRDSSIYPDLFFDEIPPPPHPLPVEAASERLSPLQLPSSLSGTFATRDGDGSGFFLFPLLIENSAVASASITSNYFRPSATYWRPPTSTNTTKPVARHEEPTDANNTEC
jgi:hypothetical protein